MQPSAAARAAALSCQGLGFESCGSAAARACEACFCCKERAAALRRGSARAGGAPTCSLLLAKSARGEALPCLHPVCSRPQRRTPKGMACVQTEWAKALFVRRGKQLRFEAVPPDAQKVRLCVSPTHKKCGENSSFEPYSAERSDRCATARPLVEERSLTRRRCGGAGQNENDWCWSFWIEEEGAARDGVLLCTGLMLKEGNDMLYGLMYYTDRADVLYTGRGGRIVNMYYLLYTVLFIYTIYYILYKLFFIQVEEEGAARVCSGGFICTRG